jgi:hypothetical protein
VFSKENLIRETPLSAAFIMNGPQVVNPAQTMLMRLGMADGPMAINPGELIDPRLPQACCTSTSFFNMFLISKVYRQPCPLPRYGVAALRSPAHPPWLNNIWVTLGYQPKRPIHQRNESFVMSLCVSWLLEYAEIRILTEPLGSDWKLLQIQHLRV